MRRRPGGGRKGRDGRTILTDRRTPPDRPRWRPHGPVAPQLAARWRFRRVRIRPDISTAQRDRHGNRALTAAPFQTCGLARWQWIATGICASHATRANVRHLPPPTRRGRAYALRAEPRPASRPCRASTPGAAVNPAHLPVFQLCPGLVNPRHGMLPAPRFPPLTRDRSR